MVEWKRKFDQDARLKNKILIVEDEAAIADTIVYALKSDGFNAVWKRNAREGIEHVKNGTVDLIVLDVGLPDINGFEFCKKVREKSNVPIIFLTARSEEIDKIVGFEIGADDYMTKPFSPRELIVRIKAVLRRGSDMPVSKLKHCDLELDDEKKKIFYTGTDLDLTRYEYGLLKVLMSKPGRVYSRDMLMDKIWDEPDSAMDRTVDAHVKSLRSKLRSVKPEIDPIVTHRGLGYSMREKF